MDFNVPSAAEGHLRTKAGGRGGGARTSADTASLTLRVRQVPLSLLNQMVFRVSLPLEVIFTFVRCFHILPVTTVGFCYFIFLGFRLFPGNSINCISRASSVMQNDNTNKQTVRHTA